MIAGQSAEGSDKRSIGFRRLAESQSVSQGNGGAPTQGPDQSGDQADLNQEIEAAVSSLKSNARLNYAVRLLLYALGSVALGFAVYYVIVRADSQVSLLLDLGGPASNGDPLSVGTDRFDEAGLLALVVPVALTGVLGFLCFGWAVFLQSKAISDFGGGLESISRLRREAAAGVSRSRSLSHTLEEFVDNSRRAFRLQLWFSRSLYLLFSACLVAAIVLAIIGGSEGFTLMFGAGSVGSLVAERMTSTSKNVSHHLANSAQTQLAVVNSTRQFSLVEEVVYKTLQDRNEGPESSTPVIAAGMEQMQQITLDAIKWIQEYVESDPVAGSDDDGENVGGE